MGIGDPPRIDFYAFFRIVRGLPFGHTVCMPIARWNGEIIAESDHTEIVE
jgi:hypothetical protein